MIFLKNCHFVFFFWKGGGRNNAHQNHCHIVIRHLKYISTHAKSISIFTKSRENILFWDGCISNFQTCIKFLKAFYYGWIFHIFLEIVYTWVCKLHFDGFFKWPDSIQTLCCSLNFFWVSVRVLVIIFEKKSWYRNFVVGGLRFKSRQRVNKLVYCICNIFVLLRCLVMNHQWILN